MHNNKDEILVNQNSSTPLNDKKEAYDQFKHLQFYAEDQIDDNFEDFEDFADDIPEDFEYFVDDIPKDKKDLEDNILDPKSLQDDILEGEEDLVDNDTFNYMKFINSYSFEKLKNLEFGINKLKTLRS